MESQYQSAVYPMSLLEFWALKIGGEAVLSEKAHRAKCKLDTECIYTLFACRIFAHEF